MTGRPAPTSAAPPRILVTLLADWPVIAAGFAVDESRPVLVLRAQQVVAANAAARAEGVTVPMRRRDAQRLTPDAEIVTHDPGRDARAFEVVVAALHTLTPRVEIVEPGVCAFPTRGPSRYFGGDTALIERVVTVVHDAWGRTDRPRAVVRVGVADGPLAARLAAARATPDTGYLVAPGATAAFLAPLPLDVLHPHLEDPDLLTTWRQLGLRTLGDVAALPAEAVLGRFGRPGMWLHRFTCGLDPSPLALTDPPVDLRVAVPLDPPARRGDTVGFVARSLAEELVTRLTARGTTCTQVTIGLHSDHEESHERTWRLDGPTRPATGIHGLVAAIADRARWQLEGWVRGPVGTRPTAGVVRLELQPGDLRPAEGRQVGFWGGEREVEARVVRALSRLESLMGPEAVRVVESRGGRQVGETFTTVAAGAVGVSVTRRVEAPAGVPWPGRIPAPSPALCLDPPQAAEVLDAQGCMVQVDGRGELSADPAAVRWADPGTGAGGLGHRVAAWTAPWPSDERWWEDPATNNGARVRQARMQLVTDQGVALLVSRRDRRWWLIGVYA